MRKVIHVITRMDMGGSAQNTLLTCMGIDKRKFEVILITGDSRESHMTDPERKIVTGRLETAAKTGVRIITIHSLLRRIDPLNDIRALYFLYRVFSREKPDIVHTHTSKAGILGRWAARLARVPVIVHTPHGHVFFGHFGQKTSKIFFYIEKLTEPITDCFVALTDGEKNDYIRLSFTRKEKLTAIHSGVDIRKFSGARVDAGVKKKSLGLAPDAPVVGFVGWLLPIKGPLVLLEAMEKIWQKYPDVQLAYIGKGDQEAHLRATTERLKMKANVFFMGWREDVSEIMQILDMLALPSYNEGMGRVLIEAMAASKPVIGSKIGGIPDLIADGVNGFLVPVGDADALSAAILRLLEDPVRRKTMGEQGRLLADQFDQIYMVKKIEALYEQLEGT